VNHVIVIKVLPLFYCSYSAFLFLPFFSLVSPELLSFLLTFGHSLKEQSRSQENVGAPVVHLDGLGPRSIFEES
jgi:hypothetical protein